MAANDLVLRLPVHNETLTKYEIDFFNLLKDALPNISVKLTVPDPGKHDAHDNILGLIRAAANAAGDIQQPRVNEVLLQVVDQCTLSADFGGYGFIENGEGLGSQEESDVLFLCSAYLEALKSEERLKDRPKPLDSRPKDRRSMTMAEKIFAMHDVSRKGFVRPGDMIQVDVDWVLASELSYANGIELSYDALGRPGIFRNDRFWLAGDHRVEPALYDKPSVKKLMDSSRKAQKEFKMTEFQGFNYTIMHTEFVRERAQPGQLIIGADSHSCSAGAISCLSIGMGATDVCMPLITGQTWFEVPETVSLRLVGAPPKGIGGKDTILYILKEFKRNTIAADRVVEFSGPGLQYLSCDARFAIANMCTEFGAVTGIFEADEQTCRYIGRRHQNKHIRDSVYFKPDEDAEYVEVHTIDLSKVESFVAVYPSPDNVQPVSEVVGTKLDGCFIGACTTAEEDILIGAYVLEAALNKGWKPVAKGRRLVVPGSRPIAHKLERLGLFDIYRKAGFNIGIPGCSMCVGQGTDQANPDETWLSSQNRNFKNRMGPGSIANLASAATVAASSLFMEIADPRDLLEEVDFEELKLVLGRRAIDDTMYEGTSDIFYQEPYGKDADTVVDQPIDDEMSIQQQASIISPDIEKARPRVERADPTVHESHDDEMTMQQEAALRSSGDEDEVHAGDGSRTSSKSAATIQGKALEIGDFIDTDAIIPSKFLAGDVSEAELGKHCMEFFMPEFRSKVKDEGLNIIVAGTGFGVGSSRDAAVPALKGAGVKAVIAKQFAFIYHRNQANLGLLGITLKNEDFYAHAKTGAEISIDVQAAEISCGGRRFPFQLSDIEKHLVAAGGITEAFEKFGKGIFDHLCRPIPADMKKRGQDMEDLKY